MSCAVSSLPARKPYSLELKGQVGRPCREELHAPGSVSGSAIRSLMQRIRRLGRTACVAWYRC